MNLWLKRLCAPLGLVALGLLAGPVLASTLPGGMVRVTEVEGITEYRLPNGLQLLLAPDDGKPTTTVNMTYRVGSRHENYGETGMAHLLEHLLFKGTPTTRNALAEFSRRGLLANGTTWLDRTNYFASFTANDENLRWFLSWHADAMVNSFISREDLTSEMTVVRNEMESGENNPGRVLLQKLMATMYEWHNYGKSTIGARTDVENVDIARLQAFYRLYYQPDNATLVVSGKFDVQRVLGWVAESFGTLQRPARKLPDTYTLDPAQDGERTVTLRRVGGNPLVFVGFHVPPAPHPDFAAVTVLAQVLGDAPGGRLHKRLVEKGLVASAFAEVWGTAEPGPMLTGVSLAPGQDVDKARAELLAALDEVAREPITERELERARTQWINSWEKGFADAELLAVALSESVSHGDWRLYFRDRDQMRKVTLADVRRVASAWLTRDNRTVATYLPTPQPARAPAPQKVDVAAVMKDFKGQAAAAAAEAFDPTPSNLEARTRRAELASGMKVALLPKTVRGRMVQLRLRLHYGDVQSLRGLQSVASIAASMLDKGAGDMTRQQLSDEFDRRRVEISVRAGDQSLQVNLSTVREHAPEVVALLGRMLRTPALPADALEEVRRQVLANIERQRQDPGALIANLLARHGNSYPRGDLRHARTFEELAEDTRAVTAEQLRDFHRRFYSARRAELVAVGDFDEAALRAALDRAFGDWRAPAAGERAYTRAPQPRVDTAAGRFVVKTPDKANANLMSTLALALTDEDPDHVALLMANHLLGGDEASRLWMRVRETDGLSYDVRSQIEWNPHEPNSRWVTSAIFAPANREKVEKAMQEEIDRARRDGFSAEELDRGKRSLLNVRKWLRSQDEFLARDLVRDTELGRRFERLQRIDEAVDKLTVDQVNLALRRHLDPARWALAVGGDF